MSTTKPEVTFVTNLAVSGFLNGVVNVAFSTAQFLPGEVEGDKVKVLMAEEITANLRFDLYVAQQLHAALGKIIDENTKPQVTN